MRKQTWLALIVCIVLMVPSFYVGAAVKIIYHAVVLYFVGPDPDPFHARSWFGVEILQILWRWMYRDVLPNLLQGLVAGTLALELTGLIYTGSKIVKIGLVTGLFYTTLLAFLAVLVLPLGGMSRDFALSIYQIFGIWIGLFRQMAYMRSE
jgi:hypothetical protein